MNVNTRAATDPSLQTLSAPSAGSRVRQWSSTAMTIAGLEFVTPLVRLVRGEDRRAQLALLWRDVGVPLVAIALFLGAWSQLAGTIETSLGRIPGPTAVWRQAVALRA
mgnify:CR=1 FL=1